jgi:hypothetical protein
MTMLTMPTDLYRALICMSHDAFTSRLWAGILTPSC